MGLVDERKLKYKDGGGGALPTHQFILHISLFGSYCCWFRLVYLWSNFTSWSSECIW